MSVLTAEQVQNLFNHIAPRYDTVNCILSLGLMGKWRERALEMVDLQSGQKILDAFCGTGGFALFAARHSPHSSIVGVDFSQAMIEWAMKRREAIARDAPLEFVLADVCSLPFPDEHFDRILIGFGLRHLNNLEKGLSELYRVLRKGGILVNLDTNPPSSPALVPVYRFLFRWIVPALGWAFAKSWDGYAYFGRTILQFPCREELVFLFQKAGFQGGRYVSELGGGITIYRMEK